MQNSDQMRAVVVSRESQRFNRLRAYSIYIDGKRISKINDGQTMKLSVALGEHTINVRIDWARSNTLVFQVTDDQPIRLVCGCKVKEPFRTFGLLLSFIPEAYLYIREGSA